MQKPARRRIWPEDAQPLDARSGHIDGGGYVRNGHIPGGSGLSLFGSDLERARGVTGGHLRMLGGTPPSRSGRCATLCYMITPPTQTAYPSRSEHDDGESVARVGVRELRQNLSVYLRRIEAGETLEVTEHGRPVARLAPLPPRRLNALDRLIADSRAIPGRGGNLADLGPPPDIGPGPSLSDLLREMRDEDDR